MEIFLTTLVEIENLIEEVILDFSPDKKRKLEFLIHGTIRHCNNKINQIEGFFDSEKNINLKKFIDLKKYLYLEQLILNQYNLLKLMRDPQKNPNEKLQLLNIKKEILSYLERDTNELGEIIDKKDYLEFKLNNKGRKILEAYNKIFHIRNNQSTIKISKKEIKNIFNWENAIKYKIPSISELIVVYIIMLLSKSDLNIFENPIWSSTEHSRDKNYAYALTIYDKKDKYVSVIKNIELNLIQIIP